MKTVLQQLIQKDLSHLANVSFPLDPGAHPHIAAAYVLQTTIVKKFEPDGISDIAQKAAISKFLEVNRRTGNWDVLSHIHTSADEELLGLLKDELYRFWYVDGCTPVVGTAEEIFLNGTSGPGAAQGCGAGDFYTKYFDQRLVGTPQAVEWWEKMVDRDPRWCSAYIAQADRGRSPKKQNWINLIVVPKDSDIGRTICPEGAINMWAQQGIRHLLEARMLSLWGIDLSKQADINRLLAKEGSCHGAFATIDSSSASDCVSRNMLKECIPQHMFKVLDFFRTPIAKVQNTFVTLHMMSTMGNAFNFPLQSIIFCAAIRAVYRQAGLKPTRCDARAPNLGVFGDDLICVAKWAPRVLRFLEALGFMPNRLKTFIDGPFRESCGADYYNGVNIRGVYIKRLTTPQDFYSAINGLLRWSSLHEIPLVNTLRFLYTGLRGNAKAVPLDEGDDAGIKLPWSVVPNQLKVQQTAYQSHQGVQSYIAHVPVVRHILVSDTVMMAPKGEIVRSFQMYGWILTVLSGNARNQRISLRTKAGETTYYKVARKTTPRWDWYLVRDDVDPNQGSALRRLATAWRALALF